MGARAEQRVASATRRDFGDSLREVQNTNDARAMLWRDLMAEGHVLTFRHGGSGKTFSAGPYREATDTRGRYALLWGGPIPPRCRDWHAGRPWDIAVRIIEYVGRQRPTHIDGEQQREER